VFTGLVEEVGRVRSIAHRGGSAVLSIGCEVVLADASPGDSIAVNGCCLTVTDLDEGGFTADVMGETLARTALGDLADGAPVNLERALLVAGLVAGLGPGTAGVRLGGHLVQGHVDGVGTITAIEPHAEWTTLTCALPDDLARYVALKGSITVDGTSLTVSAVDDRTFSVGLIPHTMAVTTHGSRAVGDRVNLEVDVIAKYVERMMAAGLPPSRTGRTEAAP
jgi:riboflavin synthase